MTNRNQTENRALWFLLAIGIAGGIAVAVGFLAQPLSDWTSLDTAYTALGRVTGMLSAFLALLLVVLMARLPVLESALGQDQLTALHRKVGPYSLYLVLAHVVFISLGYAGLTSTNAWYEFWRLVFGAEKMMAAFVGFILFFIVGITSYKRARSKLKYETWWQIHFFTYLAIVLSFFHQVDTGVMFLSNPPLKIWWLSYYIATFAFIIYYRWIQPRRSSAAAGLRVTQVIAETATTTSVVMSGKNLSQLGARGGQYFNFRFQGLPEPWASHPFSLSAPIKNDRMRITIKDLGDFTSQIRKLRAGNSVKISGPYGIFTADLAERETVVLIAGGVGITPIRAVIEELPSDKSVTLIWRAHSKSDLPLEKEIDRLMAARGGTVHKLVGSRKEFPLDSRQLLTLAPELPSADIFMCGPTGLVDLLIHTCEHIGVSQSQIHAETFDM